MSFVPWQVPSPGVAPGALLHDLTQRRLPRAKVPRIFSSKALRWKEMSLSWQWRGAQGLTQQNSLVAEHWHLLVFT